MNAVHPELKVQPKEDEPLTEFEAILSKQLNFVDFAIELEKYFARTYEKITDIPENEWKVYSKSLRSIEKYAHGLTYYKDGTEIPEEEIPEKALNHLNKVREILDGTTLYRCFKEKAAI